MAQQQVHSLITPNAHTINKVFSEKERYYIDIYQRDYKWGKNQVETLLSDIELNFNLTERSVTDPKQIKTHVLESFKPYFLNTYLTSKTTSHISIVDGQQRLTTFLIILIYLRKVVDTIHKAEVYDVKTVSVKTLEKLIFEADDFDEPEFYKIYNPNRQEVFNHVLGKLEEYEPKDETQKRIIENYKTISKYLGKFFDSTDEDKPIDVNKVTYYIYYILEKLNIVEVRIEQQENVATIFEVVNDRGLGLKPYEILKGKLLGNLPPTQKEAANEVWVSLQNAYYNTKIENSTENDIDLDTFFKMYLRAKFANTENEYKKFEGKYHYELYKNPEILNFFGRFNNPETLYTWAVNDFKYFAKLHLHIRSTYENEYLIYNKLLDQNQQYLLIMSAVELEDKHKDEKIKLVAKKFDQMHTTIRLLDAYDSSQFQELIYKLVPLIRNKQLNEIATTFDQVVLEYLDESEGIISKESYSTIGDLYKYDLIKNLRNRWRNFSKYILLRIDRHLAETLDKPSYCNEKLEELEERFNKNNRKKYGMHLEHIYAKNEANRSLFTDNEGAFDEGRFNTVRNKLGVVLLLKDKQNISSGNDLYAQKVQDYATSNIIWNELLVGHIDSVDVKNLPNHRITKILPNDSGTFPLEKLEVRQKEIFEIIKTIWGF